MNVIDYYIYFFLEYLVVLFGTFELLFIPKYSRIFWKIDKQSQKDNQARSSEIDIIRGIAILAVVIIHSCYLLMKGDLDTNQILTLSFINNILRFTIPIFLFTSGLLLKPFIWSKKNILKFYIDKLIRIGIPYIFISFVLWLIGYTEDKSLISLLVTGSAAVPLYFVPLLVQMYLLYPILDFIRTKNKYFLVIVSFFISILSYLNPISWNIWGVTFFGPYLIFFVYGMVRTNILVTKPSKKWKKLIYLYIILQIALIFFIKWFDFQKTFFEIMTFYFYNTQYYFGFAVMFTLFRYLSKNNQKVSKAKSILASWGRISLWIFLVHFPIQELVFNLMPIKQYIFVQLIFSTFLTLLITILISTFLEKTYKKLLDFVRLKKV